MSMDRSGSFTSRLWPSRPFLLVGGFYLLGMILFAIMRLLFYLTNQPSNEITTNLEGFAISEILTAFQIGMRFDQIIVLYILLPLIIILPWFSFKHKIIRKVATIYVTLMFGISVLLLAANIRFYEYFATHLNFLAYEYIDEGGPFWDLILSDRLFWMVTIGWLSAQIGLGFLVCRMVRWSLIIPHLRNWFTQIFYTILFIALAVIGIRGGIGLAPIDWGAAYFSNNHFLNQLPLNGLYTLARNASEHGGDLRLSTMSESERFIFADSNQAIATVWEMLNQKGDQWDNIESFPARIVENENKPTLTNPNIIIIIMESWGAQNTGVLGSPLNLTPNFDSLAQRSLLFSNFYANGVRTTFGLPAVLASFPALPGRSILERYDAPHPFITLPEFLEDNSDSLEYYSVFAYGGDVSFDNMEGFFRNKGYDHFYDENFFGTENIFSKWGVPDHIVLDRIGTILDSLPRPFQLTVLTLSNHEPYDLPDTSALVFHNDSDSSKLFNSQAYADMALGIFLDHYLNNPLADSSILILTADHGHYRAGRCIIDPEIFHIPLLIYAPEFLGDSGIINATVGSQVDILPTLAGLVGSDKYNLKSWGRDLLRVDPDSGFAIINVDERVCYMDSRYFYLEQLGRLTALYDARNLGHPEADIKDQFPDDFKRLQKRARAYLQAAEQLSLPPSRP